jgi:hypothetical protein
LDTLSTLFKSIEKLAPEDQGKVVDYVAYLTWQAEQRLARPSAWSLSLIEAFRTAVVQASDKPTGMDVKLAPAIVGGEERPALWAHPPVEGRAIIEYHLPIPQAIDQLRLRLAIGIRDGSKIDPNNLVAFAVRINGLRVWGRQTNARRWQPAEIPLEVVSGDIVRLELTTETLGSHEWTWAVWGQPELIGQQVG